MENLLISNVCQNQLWHHGLPNRCFHSKQSLFLNSHCESLLWHGDQAIRWRSVEAVAFSALLPQPKCERWKRGTFVLKVSGLNGCQLCGSGGLSRSTGPGVHMRELEHTHLQRELQVIHTHVGSLEQPIKLTSIPCGMRSTSIFSIN